MHLVKRFNGKQRNKKIILKRKYLNITTHSFIGIVYNSRSFLRLWIWRIGRFLTCIFARHQRFFFFFFFYTLCIAHTSMYYILSSLKMFLFFLSSFVFSYTFQQRDKLYIIQITETIIKRHIFIYIRIYIAWTVVVRDLYTPLRSVHGHRANNPDLHNVFQTSSSLSWFPYIIVQTSVVSVRISL